MANLLKLPSVLAICCYVCLVLVSCTAADECTQIDSCSCKFTNGSVIDISPLGSKNGLPRFDYEEPLDGASTDNDWQYAFNPCFGFNDTYRCHDVVACQTGNATDGGEGILFYPLGDASSATFKPDGTSISYKSRTDKDQQTRTSLLYLVCDPTVKRKHPKFYRLGETTDPTIGPVFKFLLVSECACAGGCTAQ